MGARQTKEDIKLQKLLAERSEAINRHRYYELYEMRQDWSFVFGEEAPKQKKEVLEIVEMTARNVWMEEMYMFKQIVAAMPDELFHDADQYALKWTPPGSNFKVMIPFDNPAMQESVIIQLGLMPPPQRALLLFHFAPRNPNQTMFREQVHPASLVSYHHRNEVLQKLCTQFLEDRMDIEEFKQTIGANYDVWKRAMFNMLPEDEQIYHQYLTFKPEEKPSQKAIDNEYLEGRITIQDYYDLKYPDRKKLKDLESKIYPLSVDVGYCTICQHEENGIIQCNVCDNKVCIDCVYNKFHNLDTKEGSYLLIHRRFCLKLALLKKVDVQVMIAPAYLRELRSTGQAAALAMLAAETKVEEEGDMEEDEDSEDEEERRYNEEMRLLREKKEYDAMMKENPPDLQHQIRVFDNKVEKKFRKIKSEALDLQSRIDEPGHSDQFVDRQERLKSECTKKLQEIVVDVCTNLLAKATALNLTESSTCKDFIEKLDSVLLASKYLLEMTSVTNFEDSVNGVSLEERERLDVVAREERTKEREEAAIVLKAEQDARAKSARESLEHDDSGQAAPIEILSSQFSAHQEREEDENEDEIEESNEEAKKMERDGDEVEDEDEDGDGDEDEKGHGRVRFDKETID